MGKQTKIPFEIDGVEHIVVPRVLRGPLISRLKTLNDVFDVEDLDTDVDWGVEWLAKSIDGKAPLEADDEVQSEAFVICLDFFTPKLQRMKQR